VFCGETAIQTFSGRELNLISLRLEKLFLKNCLNIVNISYDIFINCSNNRRREVFSVGGIEPETFKFKFMPIYYQFDRVIVAVPPEIV
jgi:hypothetical protein